MKYTLLTDPSYTATFESDHLDGASTRASEMVRSYKNIEDAFIVTVHARVNVKAIREQVLRMEREANEALVRDRELAEAYATLRRHGR